MRSNLNEKGYSVTKKGAVVYKKPFRPFGFKDLLRIGGRQWVFEEIDDFVSPIKNDFEKIWKAARQCALLYDAIYRVYFDFGYFGVDRSWMLKIPAREDLWLAYMEGDAVRLGEERKEKKEDKKE